MRNLITSWLIIAASLPAVACAHGRRADANLRPGSPEGAVYVNVINHYNGPVEIYATGSGTSYRVGIILPGLSSRFALRPLMTTGGPVELVARSGSGNPAVRSGHMLLAPGDVVDFRIATNMLTSGATVRP